jgi:succinate dehydrogenase assembly factor 2
MLDEPDWDIYYWSIEKRHPPERWAGTELLERSVFNLISRPRLSSLTRSRLKKHARNEGKVVRFMPELKDQMPGGASS